MSSIDTSQQSDFTFPIEIQIAPPGSLLDFFGNPKAFPSPIVNTINNPPFKRNRIRQHNNSKVFSRRNPLCYTFQLLEFNHEKKGKKYLKLKRTSNSEQTERFYSQTVSFWLNNRLVHILFLCSPLQHIFLHINGSILQDISTNMCF